MATWSCQIDTRSCESEVECGQSWRLRAGSLQYMENLSIRMELKEVACASPWLQVLLGFGGWPEG